MEIGDIVRGGPAMTIVGETEGGVVEVIWYFEPANQFNRVEILGDALVFLDPLTAHRRPVDAV